MRDLRQGKKGNKLCVRAKWAFKPCEKCMFTIESACEAFDMNTPNIKEKSEFLVPYVIFDLLCSEHDNARLFLSPFTEVH